MSSPPFRFTSYPTPDRSNRGDPTTPIRNLNNSSISPKQFLSPQLNHSPTTTADSDSTPVSAVRLDSASRTTLTGFLAASVSSTPTRQRVVRSDPSLLTSFDPADKELYDLWAPKK